MANDLVLARIEAGRQALMEARTAAETKAVMDAANAAAQYAKRQKMSAETIRYAEWLRLDAERKLGEILRDTPKNEGGRPADKTGTQKEPVSVPTLAELGIDKKTSSRAQKLAALPEETIEAIKTGERGFNDVLREQRMADIERQREAIAEGKVVMPAGVYEVISIDPPWPYDDGVTQSAYDPSGHRASNPYPEMPLAEIAALPLPAADDCVIWLWTTHKFMRHAFPLLDSWGFQERAILTWVKDRMGLGRWLRSQSEYCIMATKGRPTISLTNQTTVLRGPMREHSRKPDEFFAMVDSLCVGRKLDYFSREKRSGWDQMGNDAGKFCE